MVLLNMEILGWLAFAFTLYLIGASLTFMKIGGRLQEFSALAAILWPITIIIILIIHLLFNK